MGASWDLQHVGSLSPSFLIWSCLSGGKHVNELLVLCTSCYFHPASISSPASGSRMGFLNGRGGHPAQIAIPCPLSTLIGPEVGVEPEAGQSVLCLKFSTLKCWERPLFPFWRQVRWDGSHNCTYLKPHLHYLEKAACMRIPKPVRG